MQGFWMFDSDRERIVFVTEFTVNVTNTDGNSEICGKTPQGEWVTLDCFDSRASAINHFGDFGERIGALEVTG